MLSPKGSLETGAKAEGKEAKITNGHGREAAEGKSLGGSLKPGEGKASLFLGNERRRPIKIGRASCRERVSSPV